MKWNRDSNELHSSLSTLIFFIIFMLKLNETEMLFIAFITIIMEHKSTSIHHKKGRKKSLIAQIQRLISSLLWIRLYSV